MTLKVGTKINQKYEVLKVINTGGMSTVYIALDLNLNKNWAIKEIKKNASQGSKIEYSSLITETNILKELDHVYLPRIVDIIEDDTRLFVIMDYIEGKTLEDIVKSANGQLPLNKIIKWLKQITEVMIYLHSQKSPVIYQDMKPSNIMLQPNGNIKLFDFGASRVYRGKESWGEPPLGTEGFAAPERFKRQFDQRSDIFETGRAFFYLLTGHDPSTSYPNVPSFDDLGVEVDFEIKRVVNKMMEYEPDNRYQSFIELSQDLDKMAQDEPIQERVDVPKRLKTLLGLWSVAILFLVVGCVGVQQHTDTGEDDTTVVEDYLEDNSYHKYESKVEDLEVTNVDE